jgi:ferredoxin/DNA-binding Lrp family transcriptional regulator
MPMPSELLPYAEKLGFPESETLARIFAILFKDPNSVAIASALPGSVQDISAKTGLSEERVSKLADRLARMGAIHRVSKKGEYYRLFPAMIELRDAVVVCPDYPKEFFELWDELIREEMPKLIPLFKALGLPPLLRVIPIEDSVEGTSRVLDADSARKLVSAASLIVAIPCPCRTHQKRIGKSPACPAPKDVNLCLQINGFAESALDRGVGERLSTEEALRRLAMAEEAGLVHTTRNNIKDDYFLCNCCSCCCTAMFLHNQIGYDASYAPSRFRARLNSDLCLGAGCSVCKARCSFRAISVDGVVSIDAEKCFGCGNCGYICPVQAITLEEVRSPEFIRRT